MIRESNHFSFDGIKSTRFGIVNVKIEDGLYSETIAGSKEINEVFIAGRRDPYFFGIVEEPITIKLKFFFPDGWDEEQLDRTIRWLNVDTYRPLFFEGDIDKVYHALPIDGIDKIHNGLKEGYLELTMRCSSSRAMSHDMYTPIINTKEKASLKGLEKHIINISNKGHVSTFPDIWIEKTDKGSIEIRNLSNGNELFKLDNIKIGEKLFVDCENEVINTSLERTYRYDDFNDNYLELKYGVNELELSPNMIIRMRYKYIYS